MRFHSLTALSVAIAVLCIVFALFTVQAQTYIQYKIQVNSDNSVSWAITQVSDINGAMDTWESFQQRVASLIEAASNLTKREMSLDPNSLQISTLVSTNQSKTIVYLFTWENFSVTVNGGITFGDVFLVNGFFNQLYGDGGLQISYPSTYAVQSVFPAPDEVDNSTLTLKWLGTQFFVNERPSITLKNASPTPSASLSPSPNSAAGSDGWQLYALIGIILAVAVISSIGFYTARFRKRKSELTEAMKFASFPAAQSEEQKIVKILQSNGGSALQSAITEQSKFSKAKTSQLLSALERKGVVTRYKRGRDKIVTLAEQGKGNNHEAR
jgi:uncharacterized membrane protein